MAGGGAGATSGAAAGSYAGPIGAGVGAVVGYAAGAVQEYQQRTEASRQRRRTRKGIKQGQAITAKETYDVLNSQEYKTANAFAMGTFGAAGTNNAASLGDPMSIGGQDYFSAPTGQAFSDSDKNRGTNLARQFEEVLSAQDQLASGMNDKGKPLTDKQITKLTEQASTERVDQLMGYASTLQGNQANAFARALGQQGVDMGQFQELRGDYLGRSGQPQGDPLEGAAGMGAAENPLSQNFRTQIGVAQNSRGIYSSQAAAGAEASGMAAFQYEQQQQMLPILQQQARFGSDTYHAYEGGNIGREVQNYTGGVGVYGQANPFMVQPGGAVAAGVAGGMAGASLGVNIASLGVQQDYNNKQLAQQQQFGGQQPGYYNPAYNQTTPQNPYGSQFGGGYGMMFPGGR